MKSRNKWNTKYMERLMLEPKNPAPNPRLRDISGYLNSGTALDLACGLGGNSLFLAQKGYQVQALDISDVAIKFLQDQAGRDNLTIQPDVVDLTDLKNLSWDNDTFDIVVISYYLDRLLFPIVKRIIKKGGFLFFETFYHSPKTRKQGVSDQFKLQPKELLTEFGDWKVLYFLENEQEGWQTIFCQKE